MARMAQSPQEISAKGKLLYEAMNQASPFPCVLVGAAHLEQAVMSLLKQFFIEGSTADKLFQLGGTLGEYFGCCKLAYCVGLIPKALFTNLQTIGEIRNEFAHSPIALDFDVENITKLCMTLSEATVQQSIGDEDGFWSNLFGEDPRSRFMTVTTSAWARIVLTALATEKRQQVTTGW